MGAGAGPTERQPLAPLRSDFAFRFHDAATLERFKEAALAVLARTGVRCESAKARAIFAEHGAHVDGQTGVVRLPSDLVLGALVTAPRSFVLGSRDGSCDLDLASGETYCTTDGCGSEVVDYVTGVRRASTKRDLADITRMQDYLGSIQFWWPTVGAGDCGETAQLHELEAGWNNTVKHLQGMVQGERLARHAVAMAEVIAGDAHTLRRRPVLSNLICPISPLILDKDGMEAALVFAEAGVPVCFGSNPMLGTTAVATKAGAYVQALAEVAAATALVQLAHPGAPVIGTALVTYADPRTAAVMSAPLDHRCLFLGTELVHDLGIPSFGGYGGTDSELGGTWQAAVENAHVLMLAACDGCELLTAIGLTATYQLFTPENLLLDDDIHHRARHAFLEIPLDDESFALDVIDAVGAGGHFLSQTHTRRHMAAGVDRAITHEIGEDGKYRDAEAVARERALDILANYQPKPLAEDVEAELRRIVDAADEEVAGRAGP